MAAGAAARGLAAIGLAASLASMSVPAMGADLLSGEWVGSYLCQQGLTALTLTIEPDGARWSGIFAFGPNKDNKAVPNGAYRLVITETEAGFHMEPGAWIEQPAGYTAVALNGAISDDLTMLAGDVAFDGCTRFATERRTPMAAAPASKTK